MIEPSTLFLLDLRSIMLLIFIEFSRLLEYSCITSLCPLYSIGILTSLMNPALLMLGLIAPQLGRYAAGPGLSLLHLSSGVALAALPIDTYRRDTHL